MDLNQHEYDALLIARYQAGHLYEQTRNYLKDHKHDREELGKALSEMHFTKNYSLDNRVQWEPDIYFDNECDTHRCFGFIEDIDYSWLIQ